MAGEEVIIACDGNASVRLTPIEPVRSKRVFGALKGKVALTDAFFEPLPEDELAAWQGGSGACA